jgi:hypothetical protein
MIWATTQVGNESAESVVQKENSKTRNEFQGVLIGIVTNVQTVGIRGELNLR